MEPLTALAALLPLGVEAGKAAIQRWIAPDQVKPMSYAEQLQGRAQDIQLFQAMQGGEGGTYPWVAAVRQLQRPLFAAVVTAVWAYQATGGTVSDSVANMAGAVGFYLFGDRTLFYLTGGRAK